MAPWLHLMGASLLALGALQSVAGHMQLYSPVPRGDPRLPKYGVKDNDLNAPLNDPKLGGPFPCKHQKAGPITGRYTAGQAFSVQFRAGNSHKGGHCQFALSYDNGKTWVVLKTIIDLCFMDKAPWTYKIPLPKGAKNGQAVFAWTWMNAEGNREYYMNCADVEVVGGSATGSLTGPELFVGQLSGRPKIKEWAKTDAKQDGRDNFTKRKVVTIPAGAKSTPEGTVVGEACNGKPGANQPPAKIPWNRFLNDDGVQETNNGKNFFVATSQNPGPGVTGNSETTYPYRKGTALPASSAGGSASPGNSTASDTAGAGSKDAGSNKGAKDKKGSSEDVSSSAGNSKSSDVSLKSDTSDTSEEGEEGEEGESDKKTKKNKGEEEEEGSEDADEDGSEDGSGEDDSGEDAKEEKKDKKKKDKKKDKKKKDKKKKKEE